MSINEINAEAKESLRKYFKDSNDVKHENETRKDLYNKYFIITKNKEVEYLSLDSDKFKIHKLK